MFKKGKKNKGFVSVKVKINIKTERVCFKCKIKNTNNSMKCSFCGTNSNVPVGYVIDNSKLICKKCGKLNQTNRSKCAFCGSCLSAPNTDNMKTEKNKTNDIIAFEKGIKYFLKSKYQGAFEKFEEAGKYNNPWALLALAECCRYGYGVEKSPEKAIEYLKKCDMPEAKKKIIEFRKIISSNKTVAVSKTKNIQNKKNIVKIKVKENEESKIQYSVTLANHPILNESNYIKNVYMSLLIEAVSEAKNKSIYTKVITDMYKNVFNVGIASKQSGGIKIKIPEKIYIILYFDILSLLGFDRKLIDLNLYESIKKKFRTSFESEFKEIYAFSQKSELAWNKIINSLKCKEYREWLEQIKNNYDFSLKNTYRIFVTATMSAGKSTLINALSGLKIAKTLNEACTGRIHYIYSKPFSDGLIGKWEESKTPVLNANNYIVSEDEAECDVNSYESAYFHRQLAGEKFVIIDTPGVNSAEHKNHGEITEEVLKSNNFDLMIYVINYTVESADDNMNFLSSIKTNVKNEIPKIFLINKVDALDECDGLLSKKIEQIKKDIQKIGFKKVQVFPISAAVAYYASEICSKYDFFNPQDMMKLASNPNHMSKYAAINSVVQNEQLHLEKYYQLSKEDNKILENNLEEAVKNKDISEQALIHSGVVSLMTMIKKYINNERKNKND